MEKFIPNEKLSKKEKRKMDLVKRQTWGKLNPVTRKPENSKAYKRNKSRSWKREYHETNSGTFAYIVIWKLSVHVYSKIAKMLRYCYFS